MDPDGEDAARLRRGDASGLAGLMGRYKDRLFRYLLRLLRDEAMAEDAFQQTWLRVAERIARYDARRPFAPWLFAVARNLALDELRRREPAGLDEVAQPEALPGGPHDPFARAAASLRSAKVADALAGLGTLDREVLSLRFEEDLELPELASWLNVPLPTAKARLYRALGRLRARLLAAAPGEAWQ